MLKWLRTVIRVLGSTGRGGLQVSMPMQPR